MPEYLPRPAVRGMEWMPGASVTTETQPDRDARHTAMLRMTEPRSLVTEEVVPVDPGTKYITEQAEPPIKVGSIRGLFSGIANAIIAAAGSSVAVLIAGGTDRMAILSGLALGLTLLGSTISSYAGFAYADQTSRARKV
jgi:hypothetical protein